MKKALFLLLVGIFILASSASYASIYGQSATNNLQETRNASELGGYWPGFEISWDISFNQAMGHWHYEYTLLNSKDISHMILEVSDSATSNDIFNFQYSDNGAPYQSGTFSGPQNWTKSGNITLPNQFYGVKFDIGGNPITYKFDSYLDPVWGNFIAKDGRYGGDTVYAYNIGLESNTFASNDPTDFIVRPNGGPAIAPEPISSMLFIIGGATLGFRRFKKIK